MEMSLKGSTYIKDTSRYIHLIQNLADLRLQAWKSLYLALYGPCIKLSNRPLHCWMIQEIEAPIAVWCGSGTYVWPAMRPQLEQPAADVPWGFFVS